jgi:hypothetical protein
VATRLGLDLHPLDVRAPDTALWLRALVWPEHTTRVALLAQAIALAQRDPPAVQAGDALELLPAALAALDPEALACVYHSHVLYQWPPAARVRLAALLTEAARERALVHIALEWGGGDHATLSLDAAGARGAAERLLARCGAHGDWIAWHAGGAT